MDDNTIRKNFSPRLYSQKSYDLRYSYQLPLVRDGRRVDQILLLRVLARFGVPLHAERFKEILESPLILVSSNDKNRVVMVMSDKQDLVGRSAFSDFNGDLVGPDQDLFIIGLLEGSSANDELGATLLGGDDGRPVGVPVQIWDELVTDEERAAVEPLNVRLMDG